MSLAMVARFSEGKPNQQCLCFLHMGTEIQWNGESTGLNVNAFSASSQSAIKYPHLQGRAPSSSFGCQN